MYLWGKKSENALLLAAATEEIPLLPKDTTWKSPCEGRGRQGGGAKKDVALSLLNSELQFVNQLWWNRALDESDAPVNFPGGIAWS